MGKSSGLDRLREFLRRSGIEDRVVEFDRTTRTADDAAAAIGCTVAQIVKSLVFRGATTGRPLLALVSGANRADEARLAASVGEPVERADAAFVRQQTGYAIGGVPPAGHVQPVRTFIDRDLLGHAEIWAAAGTPHAVFPLTPGELQSLTGGTIVDLK